MPVSELTDDGVGSRKGNTSLLACSPRTRCTSVHVEYSCTTAPVSAYVRVCVLQYQRCIVHVEYSCTMTLVGAYVRVCVLQYQRCIARARGPVCSSTTTHPTGTTHGTDRCCQYRYCNIRTSDKPTNTTVRNSTTDAYVRTITLCHMYTCTVHVTLPPRPVCVAFERQLHKMPTQPQQLSCVANACCSFKPVLICM